MFQRKIDEIFKELPNGFRIADDSLVTKYDKHSADHVRDPEKRNKNMQKRKTKFQPR